ncbi:MAG: hypothetical protein JOZ98_16995 [Solirubrobacterales bacterium]|nr:hypothetical protein [Solirubrobacterales bacterium]
MSGIGRWVRRGHLGLMAALLAMLALAGGAYGAFVGLPSSGQQVNNDPPTIDPNQNANLSDLTAGSLAGGARVPWAAFAQSEHNGSAQIVVRAFKSGQWQTQGFPVSLNEDQSQDATAPSIDFTGANRTVPWVGWAEPSTVLGGLSQIFASRFASQPAPAPNGGQWIHEGQQVTGTAPSLNINTNRSAADPSLIGGTTSAGANPAPWLTWQEADNGSTAAPAGSPSSPKVSGNSTFQIFVSHAVPATAGTCPAGTKPAHGNSVGKFCFQQVGIDRVQGPGAAQPPPLNLDPSLNIDPSRDGIQADIAFTGANDSVPWVVWYENSDNGSVTNGLLNADMVFAARAIADPGGDGGFHWQVVGLGTAGKTAGDDVLDAGQSGHGPLGECAQSQGNEQACSLDAAPLSTTQTLTDGNGAENPQVTAGTLVPGKPTTPWITWDESSANGGPHSVFVARLDPAGDHFDLLGGGQPISHPGVDSTRPDISFAGNTPYVSWHETDSKGKTVSFVGHFEGNPANPVFHIDTGAIPTTPQGTTSDNDTTDVRTPVASTCPDDPFTADGQSCTGGAIGTPFYAFTDNANGPQQLFAQAYTPGTVITDGALGITQSSATVSGQVNTDGARTLVHFDYGTTAAYGASTPGQLLPPASGISIPVSAALSGLPAGTTIHYRAVAQTDFGTVDGQDQTLTTSPPPPPAVGLLASGTSTVKNGIAAVKILCRGPSGQRCDGSLTLSLRARVLVGRKHHRHHVTITFNLGSAGVHLLAGHRGTVNVRLTRTARALLANAPGKRLPVKVTIKLNDHTRTVETLVLVQVKKGHHRGRR